MAALMLGLVAAVGVCELSLRAYHAAAGTYELSPDAIRARSESIWERSDDVELAYVHRSSHQGVGHAATEASGLLHPHDIPPEKPSGTVRIAVVGDSVGAGIDLPYEQRFPTVLESTLQVLGRNAQVLNFSVNGYGTTQEARVVETRVAAFDVDAVVLQYCMNDPVVTYTPMAWFVDPDPPASHTWSAVRQGLRAALGLPSELAYVPKDVFESIAFWQQHYDPASESWATVRRGFARIADWSREQDVPVLVAIVPLFTPQDTAGVTSRGFREQVAREAESAGLEWVDLQAAIATQPGPAMQMTPGDPYHPSAAGHGVLGRALVAPVLEALGR
jgi:lysophospholipase L1-like esterase